MFNSVQCRDNMGLCEGIGACRHGMIPARYIGITYNWGGEVSDT